MVTQSRLKCRGDRAFSVAAPRLWNALPLSIISSPTFYYYYLFYYFILSFSVQHFGSSHGVESAL